ncbi:MAG: 2-phospho-L-lactate transferase [Candidatus Lokiarchaeota archaeon]|nr:2-phospho-L-lactate transferase [Candidatus Lokiarchaeota archaeon]
MDENYLLLAGGVGAAKFIEGLANIVNQEKINVIINTGDDIELFGLQICPDIDIVTYTLANIVDKQKGWGFREDTFNCLEILDNYYNIKWFNLGDKDLATHIYRTDLFNRGYSKAEITKKICKKLGVKANLIPMCNEQVKTYIEIKEGSIHFEEFYIKYKCKPAIQGVEFKGISKAKPVEGIFNLIKSARKIIICPSNPIVSIGTILSIPGIKDALADVKDKIYGISPIIRGEAIKGPADKLLQYYNLEVSCVGVAKYYKSILGHFIIDRRDNKLKSKIENLGIKTHSYDTLMINLEKKKNLARFVIEL